MAVGLLRPAATSESVKPGGTVAAMALSAAEHEQSGKDAQN